ncbi:MAG: ABC transporter permease [Paludibacteraceae bacterium]|nr:ABC transporter permease [Paludibacteraceae bacterium]
MRFERFIAERLYFEQAREGRSSRPAVRVALAGLIIGVMVMIVTVCVVVGFKQTVTDKVVGFAAHLRVVNFENNNTFELSPIVVPDSMLQSLSHLPHIESVNTFVTKPGILKTDEAFQGIVFKGTTYWSYFADNLIEGKLPDKENEVVLSHRLCELLKLGVGDAVMSYFVGESVRVRKFVVCGIYRTGFTDFDERFVLGKMEVVRRLNGWSDDEVSGIELRVDNLRNLYEASDYVFFATANRFDDKGNGYYMETMEQLNPQVFSWLDLLDANVVIIILLMLAVLGFNIISGLIILILDSIQLVGVLKALGATNKQVRGVFITQGVMLIGKGMIWGNVLGLALCAIQYFGHILPLDAATYYVNYVPISFPIGWLLLLNAGTLLVSTLILLAPSAIITKISPAEVMRFE